MSWLDREAASFGQSVWDAIDAVARSSSAEVLAGRKALVVEGPVGIALRAGISDDDERGGDEEDTGDAHLHVPEVRALPLIHRAFKLGARSVEAFLARKEPLDLAAAAEAARVIARMEDRLVFEGNSAVRVPGLLHHRGAIDVPIGDWADPARAGDDLLAALARLDGAGWHGPYAAAVSPGRYGQLFRPYPGSSLTPHAQLAPLFQGGLFKAPALPDGGVVVMKSASGPRVLVGQELAAAYDGKEGIFHRISLVESVTLLEGVPGSVAVLTARR